MWRKQEWILEHAFHVVRTSTGKDEVIELRLPSSRWTYHPDQGDADVHPVDVAIMKIPAILDRQVTMFRYCPRHCGAGNYNQLGDDPIPPAQLLIPGFPADLGFTLKGPRPMVRMGGVAMVADEPFIYVDSAPGVRKLMPKGSFLVDARIFGGNSGGPIIVANPLERGYLGGLVSASNRNLDFAIATPVSRIRETIDSIMADSWEKFEAWFSLP